MSIQPLITFKAGKCDLITGSGPNPKVKASNTPGYVYLYQGEDEFVHFCWRPRTKPVDEPETDLIMIPGDGSFSPYLGAETGADSENLKSPTDGRIFVLKFNSSSQRYLFWLQSKSIHPKGASYFSERDLKIGQVVDLLLNGEEVDVHAEIASAQKPGNDDEDETMEDVEGTSHGSDRRHGSTGGAGPGATGGDYREEGEGPREGGADGGRAPTDSNDASAIVQNFLNSLKGGSSNPLKSSSASQDAFTTLLDLLPPTTTLPIIDTAPAPTINALCSNLPPTILLLAQEIDDLAEVDPTSETAQAAIEALTLDEKKDILKRVLRSPQMRQSLGSLTVALRDGGLPNVSAALGVEVRNGGFVRGGGMPLGGGEAVRAFLEGVKDTVEKEGEGDDMDTT